MLGGCIYNLDSLIGIIPMLVFPVCWDEENQSLIYIYPFPPLSSQSFYLPLIKCAVKSKFLGRKTIEETFDPLAPPPRYSYACCHVRKTDIFTRFKFLLVNTVGFIWDICRRLFKRQRRFGLQIVSVTRVRDRGAC